MAITAGKTTVISAVESKFETLRSTLIAQLKAADDLLLTITDPSQNETTRQNRYDAQATAIKAVISDCFSQFFDSYSDNITTNAQVNSGITVQVSPATGTGATTGPGTIS